VVFCCEKYSTTSPGTVNKNLRLLHNDVQATRGIYYLHINNYANIHGVGEPQQSFGYKAVFRVRKAQMGIAIDRKARRSLGAISIRINSSL
jgi:hypothetical protein